MRRSVASKLHILPLAILIAGLAAAACSDSSGPDDSLATGDYPLFEVDMAQLPVLDKPTAFGARLITRARTSGATTFI